MQQKAKKPQVKSVKKACEKILGLVKVKDLSKKTLSWKQLYQKKDIPVKSDPEE